MEAPMIQVFWILITVSFFFMFQALTPEQVSFCASHMQQYVDPRGRSHLSGYDYVGFTNSYFANGEAASSES